LGQTADRLVMSEIKTFTTNLRNSFIKKLKLNQKNDDKTITKQANYLIIALQGLSVASKVFEQEHLEDFIEEVFEHL